MTSPDSTQEPTSAESHSVKYFFFDYDGTLAIPRTRTIPQDTLDVLDQLRKKGHVVALATGRMQCNALDYISSAGISNLVADGGYSVTIDGTLTWMSPLDLEMCKDFLHRLDAADIPWAVQTENILTRYTPNPRFESLSEDYYVATQLVPDLRIEDLTQVLKIYLPCTLEQEGQWTREGLFDGVPAIRYNSTSVFIEPMDKQLGIKRMLDHFGAPYQDAVVFGDGLNDISMFIPEWTSIAMGNAHPRLKELADYVTDDCDKGGIANACRHFGWID